MDSHSPVCTDTLRDVASALGKLSRLTLEQADHLAADLEIVPGRGPGENGGVSRLFGLEEINRQVQEAVDRAEQEILTAQPDGPRPGAVLEKALETVRRQLATGLAMRTLYQHSARFDEPTKEYVRAVSQHGVQVRTLPEFFDRLIIIDRTTAFIPASNDRTEAVKITDPSIVLFLADTFRRAWDRAEDFPFVPVHSAQVAPEVIPVMHEAIKTLLIEGHSDKAIARRLGISVRSLQAHVARIKDKYGVQSRLQLGYVLGCNRPPEDPGECPAGAVVKDCGCGA